MIDTGDEDRTIGETPSLHHIIKTRKRQESRTIKQIRDDQELYTRHPCPL